jgi:hypothetical protein
MRSGVRSFRGIVASVVVTVISFLHSSVEAQDARLGQTAREVMQQFDLPSNWSIRISSRSGQPVALKVAIGFDQTLELYETTTPFEFTFTASRFTALISSPIPGAVLEAEEWSDLYGEFRQIGGFGGGAQGKFSFQPEGPIYSSSGSGF